jgi:hypothetical protein
MSRVASEPSDVLDLDEVRRVAARPPVFIVGCPRSGTTLLRLVLDSHAEIAVPYETTFIIPIGRDPRVGSWSVAEVAERIIDHHWFFVLELTPEEVRDAVTELRPADVAQLLRMLFAMHAVRHGKELWGDKTPLQVLHMRELAELFPDARFVHAIRDGRGVSASLASMPWGPGSPVAGALTWRICVAAGQRAGAWLGPDRYREIRLEDFVADPEATSRTLCDFLRLPFDPSMLRYNERADDRILPQHADWQGGLRREPTSGLRDWKKGLSRHDVASLELLLGATLSRLGYEVPPRLGARAAAGAWAWAVLAVMAFPLNDSWAWMAGILVGASNRRVRYMSELNRIVFSLRSLDRRLRRAAGGRRGQDGPQRPSPVAAPASPGADEKGVERSHRHD